ncbi:hypothetical protein AJ80_07520 [Polytolypa hystricis UAMH7299]|uniref:Beta-lactamase-related domain-containing protein n=1 Tax=Polytolypa hystricis (strain UAMH7299) TaxID=1447883 RepID=A0A2B7XPN0_POLH7|nr:hypothetical protein AJ80_07520 [Polytolypa hystricis UAMH7299]
MATTNTFDNTTPGALIDHETDALSEPQKSLPGAICWAVNGSGSPVVPTECMGQRSLQLDAAPMDKDTVLFLASSTKLVTAVAVMQCVERGLVNLDEPISNHLPEFKDYDVIDGWTEIDGGKEEPILRKAETTVTLRHLLNHTSGISASIFDPVYRKFNVWKGWPQRNPTSPETMTFPLRFDPGKKWMYGFGIDWVGILVTRLNKCTLGEYFQKNIFDPLQMKSTTFRPTRNPEIRERLASIIPRDEQGNLQPKPVEIWLKESEQVAMESGGYGLYSTASDYIRFLQTFLMGAENPLLKKETVEEMFKPQLESAQWMRENAVDPKGIAISGNIMFPDAAVNHGLGFIIKDEDSSTGCKRGAAEGGGLTNTYWWIDRSSGVAGLVFLNMLPYMDTAAVNLWIDYQTKVYKALATS